MSSSKKKPEKEQSMGTREKQVLDRLPLGAMVIDEKGTVEFINKNLSEQMEIKNDGLKGSSLFDILEPSCIPDVLALIRSDKKYSNHHSLMINPPKGRSVTGVFSFEEFQIGESNGFLMVLLETRIRAMKREIGFEALEELPIPITIVDRGLDIIYQNSATDEMISLLSKGKDPLSKPPKERKDRLMECFAKGSTVLYTVKVKTQEEPITFNVTAVPLPSKDRPDSAMEIWQARQIETTCDHDAAAIGLGEELIETSNAIIIGLDLEGNINLFNTGASRALGYTFEEVKGTSWFDYLLDRDMDKGKLEIFQWSISSGFRTQYEVRVRSSSGNSMVISLENTVIFDNDGNVRMVLMVGQNITEMKRLETSLRDQRERLVEAMEEVALYNDLMTHDMNNANAGIMGYLELLNLGGLDEAKRKNYVVRALKEVKKSSSIIKDVKIMSQVRPDDEPVPVDLVAALEKVVEKISTETEGQAPKIDMEVANLHVLADDLIEEALIRVLECPFLRMDEKATKIRIDAKRDPSRSNLVPEAVHIIMSCSEKVISDEDIEKVFDRPKRTDLGSHGLGLYLVKKMMDRFGGIIWVERKSKKKGLEIHILLREAV